MRATPRSTRRPCRFAGTTQLVGLLLGLAVALAGLVVPSAGAVPAVRTTTTGCTRVKLSDRSAVQARASDSSAVFAAKVVSVARSRTGGTANGAVQPRATVWNHRIRVLGSYRGTARKGGAGHVVLTPTKRRPGAKLAVGSTYLFFAQQQGDPFLVARCDGYVRLPHGLTAGLRSRLSADLSGDDAAASQVELGAIRNRDIASLSQVVAPGAGLALFGLLGLLLVGRLGRERS